MILKVLFLPRRLKCFANHWADKHATTESSVDGFVERIVMFGEVNQIFLAPEFKGGRVEASFGELRLDLRKTTLPEGITVLDVKAIERIELIEKQQQWLFLTNGERLRTSPMGYKLLKQRLGL